MVGERRADLRTGWLEPGGRVGRARDTMAQGLRVGRAGAAEAPRDDSGGSAYTLVPKSPCSLHPIRPPVTSSPRGYLLASH